MGSNNPYSNYQDFLSSEGYYPNLDNIQNSEEFQNFNNGLDSQFSQNSTQSPISEDQQPTTNISQTVFQNSQLPQTNTSNTPKSWTSEEDIMLMSSWCNISENPAIGADQKSLTFWDGIWELYKRSGKEKKIKMFDPRTVESLRARYKRLNQNVTEWIGNYKEAYSMRRSGWSNDDIEEYAQKLYGKSKFTHKDVFEQVMCYHPNWEMKLTEDRTRSRMEDEDSAEEDRGSSKKSRTDGDDPNDYTPEVARKDVERAFGVLQAHFSFIKRPCLIWDRDMMAKIMIACIIMHNMIVEDERNTYLNYRDPTEFMEDRRSTQTAGQSKEEETDDDTFVFSTEMIAILKKYMTNRTQLRDREAHNDLQNDLIEHIWQKFGDDN